MFICTATCYELKSVASLFTVTKHNCQKTYVYLSEIQAGISVSTYWKTNSQSIYSKHMQFKENAKTVTSVYYSAKNRIRVQ